MNSITKITALLLLIVASPQAGNAWNWDPIGPPADILNYYTGADGYSEILCSSDGLIIFEDGVWVTYSYGGLPVLDVAGLDNQHLLLVQGDGSFSDGIYTFDCDTHQFEVMQYCLYPRFVEFDYVSQSFTVGHEQGLLTSPDGQTWSAVTYFEGLACSDIARWGEYTVVCGVGGVHCSDDGGQTWVTASPGSPWIEDLAFTPTGKLYGIFPDESWSSGLWSSHDQGLVWDVEFWSVDMSDVYCVAGDIYVSWLEPWLDHRGIAHWDSNVQVLTFMNEGLPETGIHELAENTLIDCYNLVGCTQAGAWMTCDIMEMALEVDITYTHGIIYLEWWPFPGALSYRVYSSADPDGGFTLDEGGTHVPNGWFEPLADLRKFYYVTAVLE
ncbi:MAG: hypothetical protein ISR91_02230 [Candidatus Delongbacteria bacterium]|nr:hypothetical protein [Candidatus Delongbacteria bacterium]